MIGIFSRWRQLGRRYFWPHLLLGMVAASLGLPACAQSAEPTATDSPISSLFVGNAVHFDHLIRLQESARRPNFNVDYWHQHAIRTVIRHLSFSMTPPAEAEAEQAAPLAAQKLALIDSLQALLTSPAQPALALDAQKTPGHHDLSIPTSADWQAAIHGIRAGPLNA
ncbi:secA translation cis-regulator SecM [Pantoea sp. EA-12]|uniref:secA translation cis-regulator SecM n=1 Tax=Pantoea sp. EA-12 TaxID=3043303 RepID=UPI0024B4FBDC|nr:secA translation cis-regulator SecM [Pantoea sp. EA-12]MDI9220412.1 secA translation cis-regulator SecM [Pantoea sp. EA-12]